MSTLDNTQRTDAGATFSAPPRWMFQVLLAAALYNIVWGAFAIFSPETIFRWTGFNPMPLYPELWQCIGMIVGVYGVGYAIAARNPYRHWPIVLVGLLGKVFGPIGFLSSVLQGKLPAALGWTIVTNDLIWWIPFTAILWRAARSHQAHREHLVFAPPRAPVDPLRRMLSQFGCSLNELSRKQPVLVVLLRHSGCTFCREAFADLAAQRSQIEAGGTTIALVHMGENAPVGLLEQHGLADLHCFRDPMCHLYDLFGLETGSFKQLLGPKVWLRGFQAAFAGHGIGPRDGNAFRMPGVFLMSNGEPVRAFRHQTAADRPDYVALAKLPGDHCSPPLTSKSAKPAVSMV